MIMISSESILKSIGNYVGRFLQSDPKNFQGIWKQFLRIKVAIDVYKPLKSKMRIKKPRGDWMWIKFKYERLPSFYFYCGLIGHSEKFCETLYDEKGEVGVRKYDASLRASMKNHFSSKENQWIRNADGGKLIARKKDESGDDGVTGDTGSQIHDYRDKQNNKGIMVGEIFEGRIKRQDNIYLNEGVNQGIVLYQNQKGGKQGANSNVLSSKKFVEGEDLLDTENEGITVVDNNKKRKAGHGSDIATEGNDSIVLQMGHVEDVREYMDQDSNTNTEINEDPKNVQKAGFGIGVRLSQ